ncbi:thy-1 membrane glycoprotein-like [Huso huso]|uniref:Thy-1 membrane glycoprotein-like n=1 Tax=Huso huso TaxID=61971 RepID=A0ABR0Y9N8_HUSHU
MGMVHCGAVQSVSQKKPQNMPSKMNSLLALAALLAVLPAIYSQIIACKTEDNKLRVDCTYDVPTVSPINYEFSFSRMGRETIIITNMTSQSDPKNKFTASVKHMPPNSYRMEMTNFQVNESTTFTCKARNTNRNTNNLNILVEEGEAAVCYVLTGNLKKQALFLFTNLLHCCILFNMPYGRDC